MDPKDNFLYDKRLVERHIKAGVLSQKDYEAYLKKLTDVADKGEPLSVGKEGSPTDDREE